MRWQPRVLILFELSENALYEIESEVRYFIGELAADEAAPSIVPVLGSVLDRDLVARAVRGNAVQTIYHAAAYKHVPIVESNAIVAFRNNTFGTLTVADVAAAEGVERVVLISTDKAVRPSSLMGASKRLAEMGLQVRAHRAGASTVFTIVRFGNVLDSSGSVVRAFRRQIARGGPVTVTHPGMIRYFMSIPEAASLVIQAGAMATGGDVFILDMGEPVKIDDLARSMIRLMGHDDAATPIRRATSRFATSAFGQVRNCAKNCLSASMLLAQNIRAFDARQNRVPPRNASKPNSRTSRVRFKRLNRRPCNWHCHASSRDMISAG